MIKVSISFNDVEETRRMMEFRHDGLVHSYERSKLFGSKITSLIHFDHTFISTLTYIELTLYLIGSMCVKVAILFKPSRLRVQQALIS